MNSFVGFLRRLFQSPVVHVIPSGNFYKSLQRDIDELRRKKLNIYIYKYHIIYKSSNRNKVHDKFGIMNFENQITTQIRSRD